MAIFSQELRDKLIAQISELGKREGRERDRKLKELLTKSFPVIKIKALRPVVMCILKHMSHVEDKYLKILVIMRIILFFGFVFCFSVYLNNWLKGDHQSLTH